MQITVAEARRLAEQAMIAAGHATDEAAVISDHLIDCELRGLSYGGLPRALSVFERMTAAGFSRGDIEITHETPLSALVDGHNNIGYLVGRRTAEIAIEKASAQGMAVVGARDTWHTGMLSYYAEMAAKADLVSMIASNASPNVAPHGGTEGRFGTNPIAFGFPSTREPVIWDIGTSAIMHGEVVLAGRLGQELPDGSAFDAEGNPTRDPAKALRGAIAAWGGHKGSGLAIVVQLLGMLCAVPPMPKDMFGYGCVFVMIRPDLLMSADEYKANVTAYAAAIRQTRPVAGGAAVRMPYDRSIAERNRRLAEDSIEVADVVYDRLREIAASNSPASSPE
ncbi:MAG: Ldh family oxidoreductase [Alphaproteobacteria bacterium]|nr:Ldh family oxidoreductase [Alphaproteobacteria bacterium]